MVKSFASEQNKVGQSGMTHTQWLTRFLLVGFALAYIAPEYCDAAKKNKGRKDPTLDQILQSEQAQEDLGVLRKALEEGHPGLYLYTPKDDFDKRFEQASQSFDRPMTLREFYLEVAPLVEKVYCGHTYFDLPPKLLKSLRKEPPLFPLPLAFLNTRAYADHAKADIPLGAELLQLMECLWIKCWQNCCLTFDPTATTSR